ncbi:MAG: glycosyltransferase family 4 protein [Brachyspira sp.]|nr:glycosyltransferase family 4 protein [Brachyspira sp.]
MKILFITDLYPIKDSEPTTPRTLYDFVKGWQALGHNVDVIKPNFILNSFLRKKPYYRQGKYNDVLNLNFWFPFLGKIPPPKENYDIVIAHMPSGILYADKLGLPFIAGVHNSDITVLTSPIYKFHFKKRLETALHNAKAIACRSYVIQKKLLEMYPEFKPKTFIAPSGIESKTIVERTPLQNRDKIKVLTCANLKKRKNIDKVIEALKGLESFELTVIGDGDNRQKLEEIDSSVIFTGRISNADVLAKMRESDIFILPSVGETFGMVYLEAMASGCITIGTKGDGIDGFIRNKQNGFLTLPVASEIRKLLLNIKNMDEKSVKTLSRNSFNTIKRLTRTSVCEHYLQQIFKIL